VLADGSNFRHFPTLVPLACKSASCSAARVYGAAVSHRVALACALLSPALACACTPPGAEDSETTTETGETDEGDGWVALIDHLQWQQIVDAADDPLADHRPETIDCGADGWLIEESTIEVRTDFCNYLAVAQPSLVALEQGQLVQVIFYHFDLVAPEPALGHVALLVDGQMLWEQEIAIPGEVRVFMEEFPSPVSADLGSQVVFHVHNHGPNAWVLQDLLVTPSQ
jgi:hypothetical protein